MTTTKTTTTTKPASLKHKTREQWLMAAIVIFRRWFARLSLPDGVECVLPAALKVTCGWPSKGGTSGRGRVLAECWNPKVSHGGATEIFVSPFMDDPTRVLDCLLHELVHAGVGTEAGHGATFKAVAVALGLEGPMTATVASDMLKARLADEVLSTLGDYPHKKVDVTEFDIADRPKEQYGSRNIKCECSARKGGCGYTCRVSAKWLTVGTPLCPNPDCGRHGEPMHAHAAPKPGTGRPPKPFPDTVDAPKAEPMPEPVPAPEAPKSQPEKPKAKPAKKPAKVESKRETAESFLAKRSQPKAPKAPF